MLRVDGQIDGPLFQAYYPGANDTWASEYAAELTAFHGTLSRNSLIKWAEDIQTLDSNVRHRKDWTYVQIMRRRSDSSLAVIDVSGHAPRRLAA
jgi:hypothetical protein